MATASAVHIAIEPSVPDGASLLGGDQRWSAAEARSVAVVGGGPRQAAVAVDFHTRLRHSGMTVPIGLQRASLAFETYGDIHVRRVAADLLEPAAAGTRLRVEPRFDSALDQAATPPRAAVVGLPLLPAFARQDPATLQLHVFALFEDWVRAEQWSDDSGSTAAGAANYLPRIADGAGGFRDVVLTNKRWAELPEVTVGELATNTLPSFAVDFSDPAHPRALIATDELGTFQVFVMP